MRQLAFTLLGVTMLRAFPALAADAPPIRDERASDAIDLFRSFCISTDGDRTQALRILGEGNAFARKLPEAMTERLQRRAGGVSWAMSSPHQAQLLLGYTSTGICEVRIAEAEEASVIASYDSMTKSLDASSDGHHTSPEKRQQGDAVLTFRTFEMQRDEKKVLIALTTSDRKVGEQQHLITFGFVS